MITVQQLQMARAALGWSLDVLGEKSGVSSRTIRRIESEGGLEKATAANLKLIKQALEAAGQRPVSSLPRMGAGLLVQ